MEFKSKVKNKVISGQSREIIYYILKFMKDEANAGGCIIPLADVEERVAEATGVCVRTIKTIEQEGTIIENGEKSSFSTPDKKSKLTHKDAEFSQNQQESTMEYRKVEGCLAIKLEEPDIKEEEDGGCGNILSEDKEVKPFADQTFNPEPNRMSVEGGPCQDGNSTQNQLKSVREYYESAVSLCIKSEKLDIKKEEDEWDGNGNNEHSLIDSNVRLSEDADIKPFADITFNPEANGATVESVPGQNAPVTKMECPESYKVEDMEVTPYPCELCSYVAVLKEDLAQHMTIHEDFSEGATQKCKFCSYKTKSKSDLFRHVLIHQDKTEATTYQCEFCPYKTKWKRNLFRRHYLLHQDAPTTYQCHLCPFKTKRKEYLSRHVQIHEDISRGQTYQCYLCPYETKLKMNMTRHVKVHQDSYRATTYECDLCPYNTKKKGNLAKHVLIHQDISEVTAYQCGLCPFKTKRKEYLSSHVLTHQDAAEVTTYRCEQCTFETKWKASLSRHVLVHQDGSEVTTYECNRCSFKTKRKGDLTRHVKIH